MKRNIFLILFLLVFVLCSLLPEGTKKTYIRSGENSFGDIIANLDGNYIREGELSFGDIIANIDGNYIREGKLSFGDILFNIDGPATTTQKAALAAAALRLAGRLQVERKTVRKNVKTEL
jgi:hypothetical protein